MIQLFLTNFFLYVLLVISGGAGSAGRNMVTQDLACTECHTDLVGNEVMHYPAEDACDNCHESTGNEHPGDSLGFVLMDLIPTLCFYCHEEGIETEHPHMPVSQGSCLDCHDAHGSSYPMILKSDEKELCLSCHDKSYKSDSSETKNIGRLLKGKMIPHSAIEGGGCMVCHKSHGTDYQSLLVDAYPVEEYIPVSVEAFGLCFLCHDIDLLEAEETEWGTNFRNGNNNLHQVHINGSKGRNCRLCHNLHGSEHKFLLEEQVSFGNWEMKMNFVAEPQGGSCLPGCHSKLSYSRQ